jgi:glyoxylase-like metal-dependent hydrolase (beta-lactamase superfamily II)
MPTSRFMSRAGALAALATSLFHSSPSSAQAPTGALWDSYRRGTEILAQGVAAHGGASALNALASASFRWEGLDYAPTQGRVPSVAWDTTGNGRAVRQDVQVDFAKRRLLWDREFDFPGGYVNAVRVAVNGGELLSYNPLPARGMGGTTYFRDTTGTAARRSITSAGATMPALLLRTALARAGTVRFLGDLTVNGRREQAIAFLGPDGETMHVYFDAITHLMTRSEDMGLGSLGDEVDANHFFDYHDVAGLMVPRRMEVRWNGLLTGAHSLSRFAAYASIPDLVLTVPTGYVVPAPGGPPAVMRVADGVAFVERVAGGYRMLVVDTDEGLVVVDAPSPVQASEAAIRLIEAAFPGRPIRYLVITHHHGDHIGGIPAFAARGATVLAAPGSENYLRKMSSVPRTIGSVGVRAPAPAALVVEVVSGRRRIGRGARVVDVIDVSPTSHASSMLVVYLPNEKLLMQGDLLRVNQHGGAVVAPQATADLEQLIRRFGLDVTTIGAVHGVNATPGDLRPR